jgi:hypothetical protein
MSTAGVDMDDMKAYLLKRGLSMDVAEANGWYPSRDAVDNFLRIVIPAVTIKLEYVYWQARAVSPNVHIRYQTPKGPRHGALVILKAYDLPTRKVVVVEGPMDALAVAACGYDALAVMGMTPGEQALGHLVKLVNKRPALVVLDNEPDAQAAAHAIVMRLASAGGKAHIAKLKHAKDLAEVVFAVRQAWLRTRIEAL